MGAPLRARAGLGLDGVCRAGSAPTCEPVWRQLWYDDPDSFGAKVDLALDRASRASASGRSGYEAGRERDVVGAPPAAAADRRRRAAERDDRRSTRRPSWARWRAATSSRASASLLLFASRRRQDGSGLALARVGLDGELDARASSSAARPTRAVERVTVPLGDPAIGGSGEDGPRTIHVQWRDLAGNWSPPRRHRGLGRRPRSGAPRRTTSSRIASTRGRACSPDPSSLRRACAARGSATGRTRGAASSRRRRGPGAAAARASGAAR